jgi:hypothetical protein
MNTKPDFIAVGALVRVSGFVGIIAEIAESESSILVKVESAKAARRFQKPDWLNYTDAPQLWAPATWEEFEADVEGEKQAALKSVEAIERYVQKTQTLHPVEEMRG